MHFLASGVTIRRTTIILDLNQKTVASKLQFLAAQSREKLKALQENYKDQTQVQFDELQTLEHSKCKPVSVALAVNKKGRKIVGFSVSRMPETGYLASVSRKKCGYRPDDRPKGLCDLFQHLQAHFSDNLDFFLRRMPPLQANFTQVLSTVQAPPIPGAKKLGFRTG